MSTRSKRRTVRSGRLRRHARVRKLVQGTAARPRLTIFRSNSHIYCQLIDDDAGRTLAAASDMEADLRAASATPSKVGRAEAVGQRVAERAQAAGVKEVVFDRSGYRYHGRVRALADGARSGGLSF